MILKNDYAVIPTYIFSHYLQDFSNCLYCDSEWEDPKHFFMHCGKYHSQREQLFHYMYTNAIPVNINNILYGCEDISHKENQAFLMKCTHLLRIVNDLYNKLMYMYIM